MAYAAAAFANSCLRAMGGEADVVDCAYVESNAVPGLPFFAGRLRLGPHGVEARLPLGPLNELESQGLEVRPLRGLWVARLPKAQRLTIGNSATAPLRLLAARKCRWMQPALLVAV